MSKCVFCQREIEIVDRIGVRDDCEGCGEPLHSCLQCQFYEPSRHYECREHIDYRVEHKDKANYCEMFSFGRSAVENRADREKIKAKFDTLFKKG